MDGINDADLKTLTADIVSAYVSNNTVAASDLAGLIGSTYMALAGAGTPKEPAAPEFVPAVSVRKSLASRDHIISMIDGKPYALLKRHLKTNGLTPDEYRARYNLPADYPMVAPAYSEKRVELAKSIGLGSRGRGGKAKQKAATATKSTQRRGRPKKAPLAEAAAGPDAVKQ